MANLKFSFNRKAQSSFWALFVLVMFLASCVNNEVRYHSLDETDPIDFLGDKIVYRGDTFALSPTLLFLDGNMSPKMAAQYPYVFTSFDDAIAHAPSGTEESPTQIMIAPYVYWIDNPDDDSIRIPDDGGTPFGMVVEQSWISFCGLTSDPRNVILASNRGQTQGAVGNFTMFKFEGDGIGIRNLTLGNYCNVDLEFLLKPDLNREKRFEAITQAQLAICDGDKIVAESSAFISRLNLCPFAGSKRALFNHCYFECTDDALCGTGVYLNCGFTFFSSKPFWNTAETGAAFMNCDFYLKTTGEQYITKMPSQVALVDCRFYAATDSIYLGWTQYPKDDLRCYQSQVSLNDSTMLLQNDRSMLSVVMDGKPVLNAYRIEEGDSSIYNIYGLLRSSDDWDPLGQKEKIDSLSAVDQIDYANIPVCLKVEPSETSIESGATVDTLSASVYRFYGSKFNSAVQWKISPSDKQFAQIRDLGNGKCIVIGKNNGELPVNVVVLAYTDEGVEGACVVTVYPSFLPSPTFRKYPQIQHPENGFVKVEYSLNLGQRDDHSSITWYRCKTARGADAVEVAVSRLNNPEYDYELTPGDIGYYLMARVEPKHVRSHLGNAKAAITAAPIAATDVKMKSIVTDFQNFPTKLQDQIIPGFWTVDAYKPIDTEIYDWLAIPDGAWTYGEADGGAVGFGLLQANKGARILYTPVEGIYHDMTVSLLVDPCKTAGQGFGSATGQYMDVYIKFDTQKLSGYALRIVRTIKYANAVDFLLVRYQDGKVTELTKAISATCYRTGCSIMLQVRGSQLSAHVETKSSQPANGPKGLPHEVDLSATIDPNDFGGAGIQHTGSTGSSATMLHHMEIHWE